MGDSVTSMIGLMVTAVWNMALCFLPAVIAAYDSALKVEMLTYHAPGGLTDAASENRGERFERKEPV